LRNIAIVEIAGIGRRKTIVAEPMQVPAWHRQGNFVPLAAFATVRPNWRALRPRRNEETPM